MAELCHKYNKSIRVKGYGKCPKCSNISTQRTWKRASLSGFTYATLLYRTKVLNLDLLGIHNLELICPLCHKIVTSKDIIIVYDISHPQPSSIIKDPYWTNKIPRHKYPQRRE